MKKVIWVVFIISILAIASMFLFRSSNTSKREYHIFCETLALGMNSDDVLNSLEEFGDISYSTPLPSEEGYDEIAVGYIDSKVVGRNTICPCISKSYVPQSLIYQSHFIR